MALSSIYLRISVLILVTVYASADPRFKPELFTCRLLESRFVDSQPWTEYPIVFEPINRGRLTIWSGITTLPASEFICRTNLNQTSGQIVLDFASYADKLEWTFYDTNSGVTYNGISVNHQENAQFKVSVKSDQYHSYRNCNLVENVELVGLKDQDLDIKTTCVNCRSSIVAVINSQMKELIKSKLNDQVLDNLRWHLMELISSHHYSGPIPFTE